MLSNDDPMAQKACSVSDPHHTIPDQFVQAGRGSPANPLWTSPGKNAIISPIPGKQRTVSVISFFIFPFGNAERSPAVPFSLFGPGGAGISVYDSRAQEAPEIDEGGFFP